MTYEEFEIQEALGALTFHDKRTLLADSNLHPRIKYELNRQYPLMCAQMGYEFGTLLSMYIFPTLFDISGFTT